MVKHMKTGKRGEELALEFLLDLGYKVVAVNWRDQKYELDIVALDQEQLVFVEVKTRSTGAFGNPEEAVGDRKQQHLQEGAEYYLEKYGLDNECRFDVISIVFRQNHTQLRHIIQAF
ncbi:MAG: YraN family protein [Flavobacteriales bacterium]|nr:YraN family protein [Flavobacteriales bacterium]